MKRRDFLKALCVAPAVPSVLAVKGKPKEESGIFDFSPDICYHFERIEDNLIIICEHSIWEIRVAHDGELERQLLYKC